MKTDGVEILLVQDDLNDIELKPVDFDESMRAVSELATYWLLLNQPPR